VADRPLGGEDGVSGHEIVEVQLSQHLLELIARLVKAGAELEEVLCGVLVRSAGALG
jgi:hypothetical protein